MANEYYDNSGSPSTGSALSSATIRAEYAAIEAAFDLPFADGQFADAAFLELADELAVGNACYRLLVVQQALQEQKGDHGDQPVTDVERGVLSHQPFHRVMGQAAIMRRKP